MAVTAWPVIKVDSTAGAASDTACSGAGPATALSGTANASTDAAGTTVTLPAGTDLSGVATDGSHVIYLANATAGARRFSAINAKAGSGGATPTVTVEQAYAINLTTKDWAIGGTRATVAGSVSKLLFDNNGGNGDAMPGWAVEMQSAHAESISAAIDLRRAGDTTSGPIILRGAAGAGTLPKITATSAVNMIVLRGLYQILRNFELTAGAASMSSAVNDTTGASVIDGVKLSRTSSNTFVDGIVTSNNGTRVINCEIQRCSKGVRINGGDTLTVQNCSIHDCTSHGIDLSSSALGSKVYGCEIYACGGDGINSSFTGVANRSLEISQNTIDSCTSDGIELSGAVGDGYANVRIVNNILSNNGSGTGYGLNFSNGSVTDKYLAAQAPTIFGNQTYNNTSGAYKSATGASAYNACPWASGDTGLNPTYTNAAGADFSIGTNLKAKGYPLGGTLAVGTTSSTYSYVDPGSAQRQEAGGGGAPRVIQAQTWTYADGG